MICLFIVFLIFLGVTGCGFDSRFPEILFLFVLWLTFQVRPVKPGNKDTRHHSLSDSWWSTPSDLDGLWMGFFFFFFFGRCRRKSHHHLSTFWTRMEKTGELFKPSPPFSLNICCLEISLPNDYDVNREIFWKCKLWRIYFIDVKLKLIIWYICSNKCVERIDLACRHSACLLLRIRNNTCNIINNISIMSNGFLSGWYSNFSK